MFRGASIDRFGTFQEINSTRGQLNLSIHEEQGNLIVFVSEARDLPVKPQKRSSQLDTYLKLYLMPDPGKKSKAKSGVVKGTRNPNYRQPFSFQMSEADRGKRLYISVWQREIRRAQLGCMSFLVEEILLSDQGEVSGWFYLMEPGYGDERNFPVDANPRHSSVSQVPRGGRKSSVSGEFPRPGSAAVEKLLTRTVVLKRAHKVGFGISLSGQAPPVVSSVSRNSPAAQVGLRSGDAVLRVQETDTSKSTANHVTTVLRACQQQVKLVVQRAEEGEVSRSQATSALLNPPAGRRSSYQPPTPPVPLGASRPGEKPDSNPSTQEREPEGVPPPAPSPTPGTEMRPTIELDRQEAVRAVIRLQRETVAFLRRAQEAYSDPLKSKHLTKYEHDVIFAPLQEFIRISEGIQSNIEIKGRDFLTKVSSQVVYLNAVGGVFTYDLEALVKFYNRYAEVREKAMEQVKTCKETQGFRKFLLETHRTSGISLEEFLNRPGVYKSEIVANIREVIMNTPPKHSDFSTMQRVVYSLDTLEARQKKERDLDEQSRNQLRELSGKLVFSRDVEPIDICADSQRRYVGELSLEVVGKKREEVVVCLLSDIILICVREPPGFRVKWPPISLKHVMVHDFNCVDERDFQLIVVDKETMQFRARDEKSKEEAKKMISERARGATTVRSRVQAKGNFTNPSSEGEGDPWDIWDQDKKPITPVTIKSNLSSKDVKRGKLTNVKPRPDPKPDPRELDDLVALNPVTADQVEVWKESLESLLKDPIGVLYLKRFMQREYSDENLRFYFECREYCQIPESSMVAKSLDIYSRYIKLGAPSQVNLDEQTRNELTKSLSVPRRSTFLNAEKHVFNLMRTHTYPRFLNSDAFDAVLPSEI